MESFSALLAICAGNSPVSGEFPAQRSVTWNSDVFFDLCPSKRLSKQSRGWWFETPFLSLWRHCNDLSKMKMSLAIKTGSSWRLVPVICQNMYLKNYTFVYDIPKFYYSCLSLVTHMTSIILSYDYSIYLLIFLIPNKAKMPRNSMQYVDNEPIWNNNSIHQTFNDSICIVWDGGLSPNKRPWNIPQWTTNQNYQILLKKRIWKCRLKNVDHFA